MKQSFLKKVEGHYFNTITVTRYEGVAIYSYSYIPPEPIEPPKQSEPNHNEITIKHN